jgi:hypothetical protein
MQTLTHSSPLVVLQVVDVVALAVELAAEEEVAVASSRTAVAAAAVVVDSPVSTTAVLLPRSCVVERPEAGVEAGEDVVALAVDRETRADSSRAGLSISS